MLIMLDETMMKDSLINKLVKVPVMTKFPCIPMVVKYVVKVSWKTWSEKNDLKIKQDKTYKNFKILSVILQW